MEGRYMRGVEKSSFKEMQLIFTEHKPLSSLIKSPIILRVTEMLDGLVVIINLFDALR